MWKWYKLLNLSEIDRLDVPDYYLNIDMEELGVQNIVISQGFGYSVLFLGYWITPGLNNRNAYIVENKVSAYIDEQRNLWVGFNANNMP